MRKKPYKEGDWFAVPIETGFTLGRIARVGRFGGILLGYFFRPRFDKIPMVEDTTGLSAKNAFLIKRFCDPGLAKGKWPIIHGPEDWSRIDWPMPLFRREIKYYPDAIECVQYDEDDLALEVELPLVPRSIARDFPLDGLAGDLNLQENLAKYIDS